MESNLVGVIPAAGRGSRAYPDTRLIPKGMLDICGRPVLHYTVTTMRDQLGIRNIVIILGAHGEAIRRYFGSGEAYSVRIRYIRNDRVERGLAYSVLLASPYVAGPHFAVMLSDELYWNSNHRELVRCGYQDSSAVVVTRANSTNKEIRKNFSVELRGAGEVDRVIEKPKSGSNGLLGCGTYIFHRRMFEVLQGRFDRALPDAGDMTAAINQLIAEGGTVRQFPLVSDYININYQEDIHYARSIIRRSQLESAKLSVIMPCEGPLETLEDMLRLARRQPRIGEIVLVAPRENSAAARLAAAFGAHLVTIPPEGRGGFADLLRTGIAHSTGDILLLTMDDESFDLADIAKLLAYISEADMVAGTRTTGQLVQQGSNLNWIARAANYALAKLIESLWFTRRVRLTDVGCTFRAIWRSTYEEIAADLRSSGPEFLAEMVVEAMRRRLWVVELPINYCRATEESRIRVEHRKVSVFFSIAAVILARRFRRQRIAPQPATGSAPEWLARGSTSG